MASGMLTKQADYVGAKYLNDVNDSSVGGTVNTLPSGVTPSPWQQTQPGDRILLDDITALALSHTSVGTLYGGIYMYVNVASGTAATATLGGVAFFLASAIGATSLSAAYQVGIDPQPTTTNPGYVLGIFINAITKLNYGWVQISGIASVLFDSTTLTVTTAGGLAVAKASATTLGSADVLTGTATSAQVAAMLGVAVGAAASSTVSKVALTRGFGRI